MELDDFKNIKPTGDEGIVSDPPPQVLKEENEMEKLIDNLRENDARDRKKVRMVIILYFVLIAVYIPMTRVDQPEMKEGFSILLAGLLLGMVYIFWRAKFFKKIDYTAPTLNFLQQTLKRLRFIGGPADWIILPVLLMILITSGGLIVYGSFTRYLDNPMISVFIYLGFMAGVLLVAFTSSLRTWKKEKGEIIRQIKNMMASFANEK